MFEKFSKRFFSVLTVAAIALASVAIVPSSASATNDTGTKYEFENGTFDNCNAESWTKIDECASGNSADISDWSGTGFANITQKGSSVTVNVSVENKGLYELIIRFCQPFDLNKKVQYLNVNDVNQGEVSFPYCEKFQEMSAGYVPLNEGENSIQIKGYWGYTLLDYIIIKDADPNIKNLSPERKLTNPNASDTTKRLFNYLCDNYGKHILSGQQEYCGSHNYNYNADPTTGYIVDNEAEFQYIQEKTGKQPAIRGIDFLNYNSSTKMWDDYAAERAVEWTNKYNGIATLCWHWNVPSEEGSTDRYFYVKSANANYTTFSISKALEEGTWEHDLIDADIAVLASKLQLLEDADVSVLWRPLHEAEGAWFWWGAEGPEKCKELYKYLYDKLTNEYGLNNLIWVWTGYTFPTSSQWYPGDDYVDIVGYDKYNAVDGLPNLSSISSTFYNLVASTNGKKIVTMSENDSIPSLENLQNDNAAWMWFCPWYNNYLTSQQINPVDSLTELYKSDYCITLDELPDIRTYTLDGYGKTQTSETTETVTETTSENNTTSSSSETTTTSAGSDSTPYESSISNETSDTTSDIITGAETTTTQTSEITDETTTPTESTSPEPTETIDVSKQKYGDVDLNGTINISDVIKLNKYLVKAVTLNATQKENADCVHDGKIEIKDNFEIVRCICRIISESELGK